MPKVETEIGSAFSTGGAGALRYGGKKKYSDEATLTLTADELIFVESVSLVYIDGGTTFTLALPVDSQEILVINRTAERVSILPQNTGGTYIAPQSAATLVFDGAKWISANGVNSEAAQIKVSPPLSAGLGYVDEPAALLNPINVAGYSRIEITPDTNQDFYAFEGFEDGVEIMILNISSNGGATGIVNNIPNFTIPSYQRKTGMYVQSEQILALDA